MRLLVKRAFSGYKAGQVIDSAALPRVVINPDGKPKTLDADETVAFYREKEMVTDAPAEAPKITSLAPNPGPEADANPSPLAEKTPEIEVPKSRARWFNPTKKETDDPPKGD